MKTITMTLYNKEIAIDQEEVLSGLFTNVPSVATITCLMKMFARALQEDCDLMTIIFKDD